MTRLPSTWCATSVAALSEPLRYGYTASSDAEAEGPKFLRITDIQDGRVIWSGVPRCKIEDDKLEQFLLSAGDLVFARTGGTVGKSFLIRDIPEPAVFASYLIKVSPAPGVEPRYLYWFFQSLSYWEQIGLKKGGLQGNVNAKTLGSIDLPLCPTNEQRRIEEKIEALFEEIDAGVESLRTARVKLGLYRQSLLKSAFEGRLTADWRARNADKLEPHEALIARIQSERDTRYKAALEAWQTALTDWRANGEQGKKPAKPRRQPEFKLEKHETLSPWSAVRVEALLRVPLINGRSVKDKPGGFPVLRLTSLKNGKIVLSQHKEGNWTEVDARPFLVEQDDIFLARGNGSKKLVGIGGRVMEKPSPVAFPDTMIRVRLDFSVVRPDFFLRAWNSWTVRSQIEEAARTTAGIYKINQDHVSGFILPLPSLAEQTEIVRILDEKLSSADAMEAEIDVALTRADALRQSILKKAFSGKLVPQDPTDEPASALLERIKSTRAAAPKAKRKRKTSA